MSDRQQKPQARVAVIGGSGVYALDALRECGAIELSTPFGPVHSLACGYVGTTRVAFVARHGLDHKLPPHQINYRANIHALSQLGVEKVIALNAVGGIHPDMKPGTVVVPDQLIDYTYGRPHTFADTLSEAVNHIDFTYPFSEPLRMQLLRSLQDSSLAWWDGGVYGCTQGPRLETAAEISRLERDGCDLVGMTAMPEAALARELGMEYATLCTVVNRAAGKSMEPITMEAVLALLRQSSRILQDVVASCILRL